MTGDQLDQLYGAIRDVPDFPEPGIQFKDITPLLLNPDLFQQAVQQMVQPLKRLEIDRVLAVESRGFLLAGPICCELGAGLILARKTGKLPWKTRRIEYALEYGTDAIEVHLDAIEPGHRVLVVDDVLATGGTAQAAGRVVRESNGTLVGFSFLIELADLNGRSKLDGSDVWSLLTFPKPAQTQR